ncbi:hypothetical protein PFISCL1PPCAC_4353 [Pristionchus fissidentatus]|uniref:USP domain-containing protein n=1 Tax=Pristionchus fissidentatus TaxID=1538716 RepID=A0AAV5V2S7_9BILA|nr:hypothetical protein PFISCL1PPCAC_4353 [Pristionchus fissidentatus]
MSADEELAEIFDNVGGEIEQGVADLPSSSKCAEMRDDGVPIDPGSVTEEAGGSAIKRKTSKEASVVGTKRVRIDESHDAANAQRDMEFIDSFVAMGYDKARVMQLFLLMNKDRDMNGMLDRLEAGMQEGPASFPPLGSLQEEEDEDGRRSMFDEPIQPSDDVMEELHNLSEDSFLPSSQHEMPLYVDLCDEITLRKVLHGKCDITLDARLLVVRTAALMGQRLSQVSHVATVSRLSEIIFAMCDLYKYYKANEPTEPESLLIDRRGIERENDAPFGVLIDVAEAFVNSGGLYHINDRIEDPAMSMKDIGYLCSMLADLAWLMFPRTLDAAMRAAAEKMRTMMAGHSDKEIRDEKTRREIFDAAKKVCKGMTPGTSADFVSPRYEFIERLLLCGNMDAKKNAIDELAIICDHEMGESCSVRRWINRRRILDVLLVDHLDSGEYARRLDPILRKIAPTLSEREFRAVWSLQRGRGGITPEIFNQLIASLATGFDEDQLKMLFAYFERQSAHLQPSQLQHMAVRVCDIINYVLNRRAPMPEKERVVLIERYMRLLSNFLLTKAFMPITIYCVNYSAKFAEFFRGLPADSVLEAVGKMSKEIYRMKDKRDVRFPLYFMLVAHLSRHVRAEFPDDYRDIGLTLSHFRFMERSTRQIIEFCRLVLTDVRSLEEMTKAQEEMARARLAEMKRQQLAAAAAVSSESAAGPSATAPFRLQQHPPIAAGAAVVAPPPSAVTPISNGPSPKRGEESSPGTSSNGATDPADGVAPCTSSSSAAACGASKQAEDTVVTMPSTTSAAAAADPSASSAVCCTPPCTPDPVLQQLQHDQQPLQVSTARVGSKEWDRELAELSQRVQAAGMDVGVRVTQCMQLVQCWHDLSMSEIPIAGCEVQQLPAKSLEEMFAVMIETARSQLLRNLFFTLQFTMPALFYGATPPQIQYTHNMKTMMKKLEHRPVYLSFLTLLRTMQPELMPINFMELVRCFIDKCFSSSRYNTSTEWLEEVLRLLWRLVTVSHLCDVREKAVDTLHMILVDRYRTLRLVTIFAAARINEAIDEFNRLSVHEVSIEHWRPMREEEEERERERDEEERAREEAAAFGDMVDAEMAGEQSESKKGEERTEKKEEKGGGEAEQAVDLSLESREKRAPAKPISRESLERALRRMVISEEAKTLEEAELRMARALYFLRKMMDYSYVDAETPSEMVLRDRALPGEMCEMTMRVSAPYTTTSIVKVNFTANEPLGVVVERMKKMLPLSPTTFLMHWPAGFKLAFLGRTVQWSRFWCNMTDQIGYAEMESPNLRPADDCQVVETPRSPFNEDWRVETAVKKETNVHLRGVRIAELPLCYAMEAKQLMRTLYTMLDRVASSHLQDAALAFVQQLPLDENESEDEGAIMHIAHNAIVMEKPHESLYCLISLYAVLVPPYLTRENADTAKRAFDFMRQLDFVMRFVRMVGEIDWVSERLSVETMTLLHEVCLSFIRLFFLNDSGQHRAHRANAHRLPAEPAPLDTSSGVAALSTDEVREVLQALVQFTWVTMAPRRMDVEKEIKSLVTSPSIRLRVARERKMDHFSAASPLAHRRLQLSRIALATLVDIAGKYGSWEANVNTLCNPDIDSTCVHFWRDMLMHTVDVRAHKAKDEKLVLQVDARSRLTSMIERGRSEEERSTVRAVMVRLAMAMGRGVVWGPAAAAECAASGRNAIHLVKLAERVVVLSSREEMGDALIDEWIELQMGFLTDERPVWCTGRDARVQITTHLQLLQELLKKLSKETMYQVVRQSLSQLFNHILFPFAVNIEQLTKRRGSFPVARPIGYGIAEGDVRKHYMDFVLFYAQEQPERALALLDFLSRGVHGRVVERRLPIRKWESADRNRRHRNESTSSGLMGLAQRLPLLQQQQLLQMDWRMVKGLQNPSFMCYANSVLQQLVFIPGVCESIFALGSMEAEYGELTEEEDIKNATLLRALQSLFTCMLFSAEPAPSAEGVVDNIELPNGGNVREQQDCVEFLLTLIDKCDAAAEKLDRRPVFKQHLEGALGYDYACKTCRHRHRGSDESFTALNLEMHGASLAESLDHHMDGGLMEGASAVSCEQCGVKRTTLRTGALRRAPTTLAIQLKRFSAFESNGGKLNTKIEIPRELDLTRYGESVRTASDEQIDQMFGWFDDSQEEPVRFTPPVDCAIRWRYRLVGVIVHSGQLGNGHYTSYMKERRSAMRGRPWFDGWLHVNDDKVCPSDDKTMMNEWQGTGDESTTSAYLLWYEMIEEDAAAERARRSTVEEEKEGVESTVEEETKSTVADEDEKMEVDESSEETSSSSTTTSREENCDWVDIGLGSVGLLEGPLLRLWQAVPERLQHSLVELNIHFQLGRDVLSDSYSHFLLRLIEVVQAHFKRRLVEDRQIAYRKIFGVARSFVTEVVWRTKEENAHDAETAINNWAKLICSILKENTDFCKEWLAGFIDHQTHMISEEALVLTTMPTTIRVAVSAWWFIAQQAVSGLRAECPALVEEYCRHMVEIIRLPALIRLDGLNSFFIQTVNSPYCVEHHIKHNILNALSHIMFYLNDHNNRYALRPELTQRPIAIPINMGLFTLYRVAIDRGLITEEECKEFFEWKMAMVLGPAIRYGDDYLMKIVDLVNVTLRVYGDADPRWITRVAQCILTCLKIDPNRMYGIFYLIAAIGKGMSLTRGRLFYDEILGKSDSDAAEDGRIYPGVIDQMERMLSNHERESKLISELHAQVTKLRDSTPLFGDRVMAYQERLDVIRTLIVERRNEELVEAENQQMMQGAHAFRPLPLDACEPFNRPQGSGREIGMAVSDDDMEEEDDEMLSDEEEYSDGEHVINLTNHQRR